MREEDPLQRRLPITNSLLDIIYEDEDILVINKPPLIHSVALPNKSRSDSLSISEMVAEYLPAISTKDAGLISRLDYETTGCLLIAKRVEAWKELKDLSSAGKIVKGYIAVVEGGFPNDITVSNFLGNPNRRGKKVRVYTSPTKKDRALLAKTEFSLIKSIKDLDLSIIKAEIRVGRRHQIRSHAASIDHPLIGDALYGSKRELGGSFSAPSFILHASIITIPPILKKDAVVVEAKPPKYLCDLL